MDNSFKSVENYFENNMYTMDFSFCGFQANTDDSVNGVKNASKKVSEAVPKKSMQVITMTGDKGGKINETIKKRKKIAGKPGIGLVRATGKTIKK